MLCESCEKENATVVEDCDAVQEPYRLWPACHHRLLTRSLRPLEWYNLAKRHGWPMFLLHDDFYDQSGAADQPEKDVESPELYPAPRLESIFSDAHQLLDYSITRWRMEPELHDAWLRLPPSEVLSALSERLSATRNAYICGCILEVCGRTLKDSGSELVRYCWGEYPDTVALADLAMASAECLPFAEGYGNVVSTLNKLSGSKKRDQIFALAYFHNSASLDWIESNIFEPITESWGRLAAASCLDWARVEKWLLSGRPLSLIALDGLNEFIPSGQPQRDKNLRNLLTPPTESVLRGILTGYAQKDKVPRVERILSHSAFLTLIAPG